MLKNLIAVEFVDGFTRNLYNQKFLTGNPMDPVLTPLNPVFTPIIYFLNL